MGTGGKLGKYNNTTTSASLGVNIVSDTVKPSVLNSKGRLSLRNNNLKLTIPDNFYTQNGIDIPSHKQRVQLIYNNWVKNTSDMGELKSQGLYLENKVKQQAITTLGLNKNIYNGYIINDCDSYWIDGKYKYPTLYFKDTDKVMDSSNYNIIKNRKRGIYREIGYQSAWPGNSFHFSECNKTVSQITSTKDNIDYSIIKLRSEDQKKVEEENKIVFCN